MVGRFIENEEMGLVDKLFGKHEFAQFSRAYISSIRHAVWVGIEAGDDREHASFSVGGKFVKASQSAPSLFDGGFLSSGPPFGGRVSLGARGIPRRRRPGSGAASGTGPRESGLLNGPRHDGSEAARSPSAMASDRSVGRHRLLAGFRT